MKITFVLPGFSARPVGGYAVVYKYANELSRRGHSVTIVHLLITPPPGIKWPKSWLWRTWFLLTTNQGRPLWFDLDEAVSTTLKRKLRSHSVPRADAIFATACNTALPVAQLPPDKGAKFYLMQHYENWDRSDAEVATTWRLPMHKVVIARWLEEIGVALGEVDRLTYIPNGIDAQEFPLLVVPEKRASNTIGLLAHDAEWKGTADGVAAIALVREHFPRTTLTLFGANPRPGWLPGWANYIENPSHSRLSELYNSCAIFLHPSWTEGFPLPPAEAMLSGCALVAAANRGVREYAIEGKTALLAPICDPEALAKRVRSLLLDPKLRCRLAWSGHNAMASFTWDRAADAMEAMLTEHVASSV
ncbi:MAG: glycosyltransferase family 4 protein [Acidimicrobiales bacterium]